jgi:hypothetical protein
MQGITGLSESVCFRVLLDRLPNIMQDQYTYEKVNEAVLFYCFAPSIRALKGLYEQYFPLLSQ